jgi:hypothetical protein
MLQIEQVYADNQSHHSHQCAIGLVNVFIRMPCQNQGNCEFMRQNINFTTLFFLVNSNLFFLFF